MPRRCSGGARATPARPDRPAGDRVHRRLLRRRHLDGARRPRNRQMMPDGTLVPWIERRRQADEDRRRAAQHPLDRPRLLAAAQRRHPRLRRRRALPRPQRRPPIGVLKQSFVAGLFGLGLATSNYAPPGTDPDADLTSWYSADQRRRALRREPTLTGHRRRAHHPPLLVLHRRLDRARADADHQRLDRRPVPARRGDPLLQPHPHPSPGHADLADLQRPRPPARAEQGRRHRLPQLADPCLVRPLRQARRLRALPGRPDADHRPAPIPRPRAARRGPFDDLAADAPSAPRPGRALAPGEVRLDSAAAQTIRPGPGSPASARPIDPIAGAGACATASTAPTSPASPRTGSTPPRPAATR